MLVDFSRCSLLQSTLLIDSTADAFRAVTFAFDPAIQRSRALIGQLLDLYFEDSTISLWPAMWGGSLESQTKHVEAWA